MGNRRYKLATTAILKHYNGSDGVVVFDNPNSVRAIVYGGGHGKCYKAVVVIMRDSEGDAGVPDVRIGTYIDWSVGLSGASNDNHGESEAVINVVSEPVDAKEVFAGANVGDVEEGETPYHEEVDYKEFFVDDDIIANTSFNF